MMQIEVTDVADQVGFLEGKANADHTTSGFGSLLSGGQNQPSTCKSPNSGMIPQAKH